MENCFSFYWHISVFDIVGWCFFNSKELDLVWVDSSNTNKAVYISSCSKNKPLWIFKAYTIKISRFIMFQLQNSSLKVLLPQNKQYQKTPNNERNIEPRSAKYDRLTRPELQKQIHQNSPQQSKGIIPSPGVPFWPGQAPAEKKGQPPPEVQLSLQHSNSPINNVLKYVQKPLSITWLCWPDGETWSLFPSEVERYSCSEQDSSSAYLWESAIVELWSFWARTWLTGAKLV